MQSDSDTILCLKDFSAGFMKDGKLLQAVEGVNIDLKKGETLGIVGESGCGKSVTALSIMKLLPVPSGQYTGGQILFGGRDLMRLTGEEMRSVRGNSIAMIFQEPMTALNPVQKIGKQIAEVFELHRSEMGKGEVESEILSLLERVGISDPLQRMNEYPHQLSGGMRQRVMIAMALACRPEILIADEPTTALDVTIQAQILDLIRELQREYGMSVIFITHDLGVIAELCDNVAVMYAGKVIEKSPVSDLFEKPLHPYTSGLIDSIPKFEYQRKTKLKSIEGMVPSIAEYPAGCRFRERCSYAFEPCPVNHPGETETAPGHTVNCFRYGG